MKSLRRVSRARPIVGIALGLGMFVADMLLAVRPFTREMNASFPSEQVGIALVIYAACFAALDALLVLARVRSLLLRGAILIGLAAALLLPIVGELIGATLLAGAVAFTFLAFTRFAWPIPALFLAFVLVPIRNDPPATSTEYAAAVPDTPAIALIVLDTVRFDRTSHHGYDRDTTPNLARLARRQIHGKAPHGTHVSARSQ